MSCETLINPSSEQLLWMMDNGAIVRLHKKNGNVHCCKLFVHDGEYNIPAKTLEFIKGHLKSDHRIQGHGHVFTTYRKRD